MTFPPAPKLASSEPLPAGVSQLTLTFVTLASSTLPVAFAMLQTWMGLVGCVRMRTS
ncbi:hypothetical protein D3C83_267470 [compost metagenome]